MNDTVWFLQFEDAVFAAAVAMIICKAFVLSLWLARMPGMPWAATVEHSEGSDQDAQGSDQIDDRRVPCCRTDAAGIVVSALFAVLAAWMVADGLAVIGQCGRYGASPGAFAQGWFNAVLMEQLVQEPLLCLGTYYVCRECSCWQCCGPRGAGHRTEEAGGGKTESRGVPRAMTCETEAREQGSCEQHELVAHEV